jgi:hypothetical protein
MVEVKFCWAEFKNWIEKNGGNTMDEWRRAAKIKFQKVVNGMRRNLKSNT